ncbi:MAG: hypothetical protein V7L20_21310 [Nostoc sp.]
MTNTSAPFPTGRYAKDCALRLLSTSLKARRSGQAQGKSQFDYAHRKLSTSDQ